MTHCPSTNLAGCCALAGFVTCDYSDNGGITMAQAEGACAGVGGTFCSSPP